MTLLDQKQYLPYYRCPECREAKSIQISQTSEPFSCLTCGFKGKPIDFAIYGHQIVHPFSEKQPNICTRCSQPWEVFATKGNSPHGALTLMLCSNCGNQEYYESTHVESAFPSPSINQQAETETYEIVEAFRCPDCKRTRTKSAKGQRICLDCGYTSMNDKFEIREIGLGYPTDYCTVCACPWDEADVDEKHTQLCRMLCPKCGFEKYFDLRYAGLPEEDSSPLKRRKFGKPKWNVERVAIPRRCPNCSEEWDRRYPSRYPHLTSMFCENCTYEQHYKRHADGGYELVTCECVLQVGKHQYRRVNVDGKYEYLCRSCGKQRYVSRYRYVTAQGIIEEWLTSGEVSVIDDDITTQLEPDFEPVSDLGFVYECKPIERGYDSFLTSQLEAPTAPLKSSHREMAARYRKIIKHQKVQELTRVRKSKTQSLVDMIAAYCSHMQVQSENLPECLDSIKRCITAFDEIVLSANRLGSRGGVTADRVLTDKQLEQVAAAATYHYLPELTQEQVVGSPESIFPNLTRPTLGSWLQYVKHWDPL